MRDHDATFHHGIAKAGGDPLLYDAVTRLRAHMHLDRLYFQAGIAPETMQEHQRILAALREGDPRGD
ncbi:MAG: FCD domain-containing protein [Nocardioidaceae bacterium]